ncbi:MAG: 50S ribosomal protein L3 N(5)-glutamine methyltransferase [Thiohalomonadales bacterium]
MTQIELPTNLSTLGDYVRWAASQFSAAGLYYGHGNDNALDEAYHLITAALHLPHEIPMYMMDVRLTDVEMQRLQELLRLRITQRIPVPYLLNRAWFAGLEFFVDDRVLIPRSPIAELIQSNFAPWVEYDTVHNILDLCTGGACIAIAVAKQFPDAFCVGSDNSSAALEVAQANVEKYKLGSRLKLIESDLFTQIPTDRRFDIIVSNPPYVDAVCMDELPAEYLHEPRLALAAGEDGLDMVRSILKDAANYLSPQGILIVEVGNSQAALVDAYPNIPFCWLDFEHGGDGVFLLSRDQLL